MECLNQYRSNQYISNINRVEFTITNACTGRCKHCSEGTLKANQRIDANRAVKALHDLAGVYDIRSIMTFGGEALIYPEITCKIHEEARRCTIPLRQIITNGCFSKDTTRIGEVARMIEDSGINDILLSVDCFHAEYLPLEWTRMFAEALCKYYTGQLQLQPSWVRKEEDQNPYNEKTRECLRFFDDLKIKRNKGDVIFASGNAINYLGEYLEKKPIKEGFRCGKELYSTKLDEVDELMIDSNGDVLPCNFSIGNLMENDILDILAGYDPYQNPYTKALLEEGIQGLVKVAKDNGILVNPTEYYSPCEVCRAVKKMSRNKTKE